MWHRADGHVRPNENPHAGARETIEAEWIHPSLDWERRDHGVNPRANFGIVGLVAKDRLNGNLAVFEPLTERDRDGRNIGIGHKVIESSKTGQSIRAGRGASSSKPR